MKTLNYLILLSISVFLLACSTEEKKVDDITVIDVSKTYPEKEVVLQDIADVQYYPLETNDSVLINRGNILVPVSDENFILFNPMDGDVLFFNNHGELLNKFNRKGQSGEEYLMVKTIVADPKLNELYIFELNQSAKKRIQVYTFDGDYKRTLYYPNEFVIFETVNFDDNELLGYHAGALDFSKKEEDRGPSKLLFISKETGSIDSIIELPQTKDVNAILKYENQGKPNLVVQQPSVFVKNSNEIIINEIACDTIFSISKDKVLTPVLVRTPKVNAQDKPMKMLGINAITSDSYYFQLMSKEYNREKKISFPTTHFRIVKESGETSECVLKNTDVTEADKIVTLDKLKLLKVDQLKELLEENKLKGKLKQVAENLDEDANPVIMNVTIK